MTHPTGTVGSKGETMSKEEGSQEYAALELYTNMLYLIIRYNIDGFAEPAITRSLETYSKTFLGNKDRWVADYTAIKKTVEALAND